MRWACCCPDLYGEFYSEVIRGLDLAARGEGFHLLVSSSHAHTAELMDAVRSMRGRIDGLIVMAPDVDAPAALEASGANFPIVLIDPGAEVEGFDTISIANFEGAYAMTRHLAKLGHRASPRLPGRSATPTRGSDSKAIAPRCATSDCRSIRNSSSRATSPSRPATRPSSR